MTRKPLYALVGVFLLSFLLVALVPAANAAPDGAGIKGKIQTLDFGKKTVTIVKGDSTTVTLKFNSATVIRRNNASVKAAALVLHDNVTAKARGGLATSLTASGPAARKIRGGLDNALKGSGLVTINGKQVRTNAQTRISRNGKLVGLSQLTRKDTLVAHVKGGANAGTAQPLAADLIADGPEDTEVHGLISVINGSEVTITPDNGTPDVTVNVTADTMIEKDGEAAALADLAVGMQVKAEYDPATLNAFSIETDSHGEGNDGEVHGTVASVDTGASTVTITPDGGGSNVTLNVDSATEILVNRLAATLGDIQTGMPIEAKYDTLTMLATEIKAGAEDHNSEDTQIEGTIAAVDTGALTVTITPNGGGANVTLNVTTSTEIEVNGDTGSITDLAQAQSVRAEYDPATMNAFEIKAGSEDGGGDHGGGDNHGEVTGNVTGVDTGANTVTITPNGGSAVTVNITGSTEIKVNGKHGTIADVQVGQWAKAEYDANTLDASELKVGNQD